MVIPPILESTSSHSAVLQNVTEWGRNTILSTKRGSTGTGSSRTQKIFCQKMFQLTPRRCVKKIGTFGADDPKGMEGP